MQQTTQTSGFTSFSRQTLHKHHPGQTPELSSHPRTPSGASQPQPCPPSRMNPQNAHLLLFYGFIIHAVSPGNCLSPAHLKTFPFKSFTLQPSPSFPFSYNLSGALASDPGRALGLAGALSLAEQAGSARPRTLAPYLKMALPGTSRLVLRLHRPDACTTPECLDSSGSSIPTGNC